MQEAAFGSGPSSTYSRISVHYHTLAGRVTAELTLSRVRTNESGGLSGAPSSVDKVGGGRYAKALQHRAGRGQATTSFGGHPFLVRTPRWNLIDAEQYADTSKKKQGTFNEDATQAPARPYYGSQTKKQGNGTGASWWTMT